MMNMIPIAYLAALGFLIVHAHMSTRSGVFLKTASNPSIAVSESREVFRSSQFLNCLIRCLRKGDVCRGWQLIGDDNECQLELLEADDHEFGGEIVNVKYQRYTNCKFSPCVNGGTCVDSPPSTLNTAAYVCHCICGSCGSTCEILNFGLKPKIAIAGKNLLEVYNTSVEDCMRECLLNPECKSFDYGNKEMKCYLNKEIESSESMEHFDDIDYYYPNCTCPRR